MTDDELCYLSATEAVALFKARKLSPIELLDAVIRRGESVADTVNSYADTYFDEARARAKKAEARYMKSDGRPRRLEGAPLAVKDTSAIKGKRATFGSLINKDAVAERTDPDIERLMRAGANIFTRTTTPEFGWLYTTQSRMWGVTRNPWRLEISPGGSSGGSASALAAGATTVATGGDSTGSIRQPASQCGVVGYQAPFGRIPMTGAATFNSYVHHGPMTRTVADAALMANVMSGPHALDHASLKRKVTIPDELPDIRGMKIAFSIDLGHYEVIDDVRRETHLALDALREAGAEVSEVAVDWASEAIRLGHGNQEFLFASELSAALRDHGDIVSAYVPQLEETALSFTADDYRRSLTLAGEIWDRHLGPLFRDHDAFVTPTVSCPEIPAEGWQKDTITVNGRALTDTDTSMTVLWNMFGRCPVLAVPSGLTDSRLPTGIQIVGRPEDDVTVFRIAAALETRRPWLDCAERRPPLAHPGQT
jgi:amidase